MATIRVQLANLHDTEAAVGWAGGHTVVVDRPQGRAGGRGLGFNGGELLALAIGGCLCNDLRYVAHELGVELGSIKVTVDLALDGTPARVTGATMVVACETLDGSDPRVVVERAEAISTISNSLTSGFPVALRSG